jgi:hypothetical protein
MKVVHRNLKDRMQLTLLNDFRAVASAVAEFPGREQLSSGNRYPCGILRKETLVRVANTAETISILRISNEPGA